MYIHTCAHAHILIGELVAMGQLDGGKFYTESKGCNVWKEMRLKKWLVTRVPES